ncbi:hypothetical protein JW898_04160 [Candidatus Woesearchaeota archaeon]|nr:hypothetical protein [Candidatus Woesearchaeota archaeon]
MHKLTYLMVLFTVLLAASAIGASSRLDIDKVEILSGTKTLTSGTGGSFKVTQGDEIRVRVKVKNTYSESSHNDIDELSVVARIRDIDDGDDIDDEIDDTYVRAYGYKTVTLELDIPDDADTDQSYNLDIIAEGTDQNGTLHTDEAHFDIEMKEKEDDDDKEDGRHYDDADYYRYLDDYHYRTKRQREEAEQPLGQYSNPNRDLRYLFGSPEPEVVLQIAPQLPKAPQPPRPAAPKESAFSITVLLLANIALIVFIVLLTLTWYNRTVE